MLVSVIIPCYNAAPFVGKAIQSILNQKETGEVILVEDGSTDNSLQICEELQSKYGKVKLFRHSDGLNHGAGASRNLGISKAQYEYVAFLDADDYYIEGRFSVACELLARFPEIEGVFEAASYWFYSEQAKSRYHRCHKERNLVYMENRSLPLDLFETFLTSDEEWFPLDTLTVRRRVFKKIGYFDESLRQTQDTDWILRLCLNVRLMAGKMEEPVAIIGVHDHNRVHNQEEANHYRFIMLKKWWPQVLQASISKKAKLHFIRSYLDCHPWVRRFDHTGIRRKTVKGLIFLLHLVKSPGIVWRFL